MKKVIQIPKKIFENMFFSEGGTKTAKILTGSKQFEEKIPEAINANVEGDEWIKDSEGLREVVGDKHAQGGVDVNLEDGAKVLSDKGVIGKTLAKEMNEEYKVKLKETTTYAEALDKIQIKIGLERLNEEQEKLIKKLEYQQKNVKDENTLSANTEYLSGRIKEVEDRKRPVEEKSKQVFEYLFEKQESKKTEKKEGQREFAEGGINEGTPKFRVGNKYEDWKNFKKQKELEFGVYGTNNKSEVVSEIKRLFPKTASVYFNEGSNLPKDSKLFQQDYNRLTYDIEDTAKKLYGEESEKFKALQTQMQKDRFTDGDPKTDIRSFDGKFGNFTSTRPNYELELLPEDILKKVKEAGVNTVGQLREQFPEDFDKYVGSLDFNVPDDAWVGVKSIEIPASSQLTSKETEISEGSNSGNIPGIKTGDTSTRYGVMAIPDQTPNAPTGIESHLKTNRRYERLDFRDISPEQQLMELNKLSERAQNNLDMMPPQQKASLSANILATQADQTNKILSQVNQYNTQGQQQIDNQNAQIQMQENIANAQDSLNFEQRQMLAKAKTEADYNSFYNKLQENNLSNYSFINNTNLANAMYDHFQITDKGIEQKGYNPQFMTVGKPVDPRETAILNKMKEIQGKRSIEEEAKARLKNNK